MFFLNEIILDEDLKLSAGCQMYGPPFPRLLFSSPPASIACVMSVCKIMHSVGSLSTFASKGTAIWHCVLLC